ncbi:C-C motif chemokine 17-like [Narcine bancroftii]|uniref:C-C motif chemokine 17-like n=1 Tax=Narcine bancroftii TaxID=1343680 RepID=UPI0038310CFC
MKQVLVVLICFSVVCFVVSGAPTLIRRSCCKKYSKRVPDVKKILHYEIQTRDGQCNIPAVKFTVQNRRICSDPRNKNVIRILKDVPKKQ